MQETWVWSLNHEDSLEKEMATHSNILLGNPMDRGACRLQVHGVTKESDMTEWLNNNFFVLPWNPPYSAFQSDHCFKWPPDPSKYPLGAQVKGESDMTTEIYFREVGGWECLGSAVTYLWLLLSSVQVAATRRLAIMTAPRMTFPGPKQISGLVSGSCL